MNNQPGRNGNLSPSAVTTAVSACLRRVGCGADEARFVADSLVTADMLRLHSHGVAVAADYVAAVESGGIVPNAAMRWVIDDPAAGSFVLDAAYGFGQSAMRTAVERVTATDVGAGCAVVAVRRSTHYGAGRPWVAGLAEAGQVAFLCSTSGPCVAPYGTTTPLLGTNPITIAVPRESGPPVVLDMATSVAAMGVVAGFAAEGRPLPEGWAYDSDGQPTTDPDRVVGGALRPFGGHKGSGLAVIVELLAGALTGARFSYECVDLAEDPSSQMGTGHLLVTIDVGTLTEPSRFLRRVDEFAARVHGAETSIGPGVFLPGEIERAAFDRAARYGLELPGYVRERLCGLCARLEVEPPDAIRH